MASVRPSAIPRRHATSAPRAAIAEGVPAAIAALPDSGAEGRVTELLATIEAALKARDIAAALRSADRLWRQARDDVSVARLYGRILAHAGDHAAALRLLTAAADRGSSPEAEAQIIEVLLAARALDAAAERLGAALRRFCVTPDGRLATMARRTVAAMGPGPRGWVGVAPTLELIGEVTAAGRRGCIELRSLDGSRLARKATTGKLARPAPFRFAPPDPPMRAPLAVLVDGVPLIGSDLAYPPEFELDGRATTAAERVSGWVTFGWHPDAPVELVAEDERGSRARIAAAADPAAPGRRSFGFAPSRLGLAGNRIFISAVLPDGSMEPLPDTPLLLEAGIPPFTARGPGLHGGLRRKPALDAPHRRRPVDVIVPVYRGREETLACLATVAATLRPGDAVIVIDDASPDPELAAALAALARRGSITLLKNGENQGFAASVNRGLEVAQARDAILLNADATVGGDWIDRMQRAAYRDRAIGTVTPLTNNGAIASYPGGEARACGEDEARALDGLAAAVNAGASVELPVGVGFCLYLRRDCLAEVGPFDAATFGKGYGEENDFCMRAQARGWRHVLAADVFVRHAGGLSFGRRAAALRERNTRLLNLRHPGYDALVAEFIAADPVRRVRRPLDEARLAAAAARHVLLVTLDLPGGVERLVQARCRELRAQGLTPLLVRPLANGAAGCAVATEDGLYPDLRYAFPDDRDALAALLARIAVDHVEIHHFLGFEPGVIETIRALDAPYDVYVHDYVWICPRISLVGGDGKYCGEPGVGACESCVRKHGSQLAEAVSVARLRRRSARWLEAARAVIVPCADVAERLARYFPAVAARVAPWEDEPERAARLRPRSDTVRVAVIGAIGEQKGYAVLHACARDAARRKLDLEFVVIGFSEDDAALAATGKVFVTGRYEESELHDLIRRERPHLVLFPSVAPETWCYTLTEALRADVPVIAFDFGAIAERLRGAGTGVLIPFTDDPVKLNEHLLRAARENWDHPSGAIIADAPPVSTEFRMQETLPMNPTSASAQTRSMVSGGVEAITLAKGRYRFSVRSGTPARVETAGNLALPAVHVEVGPGIAARDVKLTPSVPANGAWLFESGHRLEVKVLSAAATLVLTSLRSPGGQALVIEVDRLDAAGTAPQPAGRAAPAVAAPAAAAPKPAAVSTPAVADDGPPGLRRRIVAHVRNRGDMDFGESAWAGRVAPGLWLEAFAVTPLERVKEAEIEYKGLTHTGIETPWIGNGAACGTRGMGVPLVGFAVRLKPAAAAKYDCTYSGYFHSGAIVGPLRNGAPCRSAVPNDPLEGIRVRIVARRATAEAVRPEAAARRAPGPRFSKLREETAPEPPAKTAAAAAARPSRTPPRVAAAAKSAKPKSAPPVKAAKPAPAPKASRSRKRGATQGSGGARARSAA